MSQPVLSELAPPRYSELIFDDGEPLDSEWHAQQLPFLGHLIHRVMAEQGRSDYHLGWNNFVYYTPAQALEVIAEVSGRRKTKRAFRGPDVYWVGDVADPARDRDGWVSWLEDGKLPDVIVEVLSHSTARKDRTEKKALYEQVFATAEYFLCDPDKKSLEGYRLAGATYRPILPDFQGRLWSEQLGAAFGRWHGEYAHRTADWYRLFRADGSLVPEIAEVAEEQRRRAEDEHRRAEEERQRAEAADRRAAAAEAELADLRAELQRLRQG